MTKSNPKYTTLRNTTYWLHFKLPTAIFNSTNLSSQLIRYSLNTKDADKAASLANLLVFKIKEHCSITSTSNINKGSITNVILDTLTSIGEMSQAATSRKNRHSTLTVSTAYAQFREEMLSAGLWRVKSEADSTASVKNFIELIGDIDLSKVDAAICRQYKSQLIKYPLHRSKLPPLKNKCIHKIINSSDTYARISTTTVNNQIRKVNAFFNWSVRQGLISSNPLSHMKIKQKVLAKSLRLPFSEPELRLLFTSPLYSQHKFSREHQYWLPLLALYTSARLEEICQLYVNDVSFDEGLPLLRIDNRYSKQHIKNESSRRIIPIHQDLINLGFAEFIKEKQNNEEQMLFGYLVPQRQKLGHKPSQWFSKYKTNLGITDKKKVFHSFRHNMVDALKQLRAHDYEIKAILGHQSGSITYDIYGSDDDLADSLTKIINRLDYQRVIGKVKPWRPALD